MPAAPIRAPVKNTFIHYDEAPSKLRRVSSAPAEFPSTSGEVHPAMPAPPLSPRVSETVEAADLNPRVNETVEEQHFAPARKKARVVRGEDDSSAHSKRLDTDQAEEQGLARGRSKTRSSSRSQPRCDAGGNVSKELTEVERLDKAKEWVAKMKDTSGYMSYLASREAGDKTAKAAPRTPDPTMRITSKRKWERAIMSWRISLRRWGTVTVSAEDLLGVM